jgi:ATP-dependent Lon protease
VTVAVNAPEEQVPESIPNVLPVLPLRGTVLYPGAIAPLTIGRGESLRLIDDVMRTNRLVLAVAQRDANVERPTRDDLVDVGTVATVLQLLRTPDGGVRVALQGVERARLLEVVSSDPYLVGKLVREPDRATRGVEVEGLQRAVVDLVRRLVPLLGLSSDVTNAVEALDEPLQVAYAVATALPLDFAVRQDVLELGSAEAKLRRLVDELQHELAVRELGQSITERTQERLTRLQREAILREQLRSIQAELGEGADGSEVDALRRRIEQASLPPDVRREAERELDRLGAIPEASPEHGLIRTWLEWIADLPWGTLTGAEIDVPRARAVLDEDHYDLKEVKDRILEHLAVQKLRRDRAAPVGLGGGVDEDAGGALEGTGRAPTGDETLGETAGPADESSPLPTTPEAERAREPILVFVGPPGVGKTSLGQSIARALGRKFLRMSLGGVRDEAEIRGHRRTYVGALPGRIIQGLRRVETRDPVFMLDEIDKVGADWRGDPTSALLEVLDPAQNYAFSDTYLGVPFDLSQVLFIGTANTLETIPGPLLDRMEIIRLAGYTDDEKVRIAERYLVPLQRRAHGLTPEELDISEDAIREIIRGYTREAGVRELDRRIAQVCRKAARRVAESMANEAAAAPPPGSRVVTAADLPELLGRRRHFEEVAERTDRPGIATGLAWTPTGGEVLFVEAAMTPDAGDPPLLLTGMLGDVMRESAQAALTYVRSEGERFGIGPEVFRGKRVHVHVPAGALPKDGPSAGVTMATALASLALRRPVRDEVAMTGEVTLRGKVLPVGGIKEKVLAAHRAGLRTIILPRRNEPDLEDLPEELRRDLQIRPIDRIEDAFAIALGIDVAAAEGSEGLAYPHSVRAAAAPPS